MPASHLPDHDNSDPARSGGGEWVLRPRRTRFVDLLRTTPTATVCPNFYLLAHANGCAFSPLCSYCYLQSSLWSLKQPHVFTNTDDLLAQVREWIGQDDLETYVLNTGNLSDSLVFEKGRPLIAELLALFRTDACSRRRPHTLLLVTKGGLNHCDVLLRNEPCANVIVSFSVNHAVAAQRYEAGVPPPAERLAAAAALLQSGWRVRLRMDPMILGFDYRDLARHVADTRPERVTLGSLRVEPNLRRHLPAELLAPLAEPATTGAYARYPLATRVELYRSVLPYITPVCRAALCEETPDVWNAVGLDTAGARCNCGL